MGSNGDDRPFVFDGHRCKVTLGARKPGAEPRCRAGLGPVGLRCPVKDGSKEKYKMNVLVVYASRYGATQAIAERITGKLNEYGQHAEVVSVSEASHIDGYDAYVIGSAI